MKNVHFASLLLAIMSLVGCSGRTAAPAPGVLAACAQPITATATGIVLVGSLLAIEKRVNSTITLANATGTAVTTTGGATPGLPSDEDPMAGGTGTGTLTSNGATPPVYSFTTTHTVNGYKVTVTGTVTGPPSCSGTGRWTAIKGNNTAGQGNWTIP